MNKKNKTNCSNCELPLKLHMICPMCKGTGRRNQLSFVDSSKEIIVSCRECHGTGRLQNCVSVLQDQLKIESKWASYCHSCAECGKKPSTREDFLKNTI